jgi:anti-sigma regulatory factor (Ser/Thr protein kinase)
VRRIITRHWVVWQIQDEGPGIPAHARNHQLPLQPDSINGRGLFLIHHCFDDVRWSGRGNRLQLAARRPRLTATMARLSAGLSDRALGIPGR